MCDPVIGTAMAIGAATGAAGSALTGGDPLQGALFGAATGAFTGGTLTPSLGPTSTGFFSTLGSGLGSTTYMGSLGMSAAQAWGIGIAGLATSVGTGLLIPQQQDYSQYYQQTAFDPIAYNTQQSVVTGSGGRQASALLAEEIKRAKKRRAAQADIGDIDLATSLSNTGLQIA